MKTTKEYKDHILSYYKDLGVPEKAEAEVARERQFKMIMSFSAPAGMSIEEKMIPGLEGNQIPIRIYRDSDAPAFAPATIDIHGGGWIHGNLDIDNSRCAAIARETKGVVVGVDYRLASEKVHFPAPILDCTSVFLWLREHGGEIGVDSGRIAVHGTSAGGNLSAGMALYLRDHYKDSPALTIINCPVLSLDFNTNISHYQYRMWGPDEPGTENPAVTYLGGLKGEAPSYYAFPGLCPYFDGLGPHMVIVGEYDPFRDDGINYAEKLLASDVPCELIVAPRVGHGFCTVRAELTDMTHRWIGFSLKREFAGYGK